MDAINIKICSKKEKSDIKKKKRPVTTGKNIFFTYI